MDTPQDNRMLVIGYIALRRVLGILGFILPIVVAFGAWIVFGTGLQGTLSNYYHTHMRDVFVGAIWAIAFILYSYKGYDRGDDWVGNLACIFAIGLSLFPATKDALPSELNTVGIIHVIFAFLFFLMLIYMSAIRFTKSRPNEPLTPQKTWRNRMYYLSASIMIVCMVAMVLYSIIVPEDTQRAQLNAAPIFWLESITIMAFGLAWGIKGQIFFKDADNTTPTP